MASSGVTLTDDQMLEMMAKQTSAPAPSPKKALTDDEMARLMSDTTPQGQTAPKLAPSSAPDPNAPEKPKTGLPEGVTEWKGAGGQKLRMHSDLSDPFMLADEAYSKATGNHIGVGSSYRSTADQKVQYDKYAPQGKRVAKPGHSLHEKGRALDVKDWKTVEPYLKKAGFVNPFPDDPNHFILAEDNPYTTGKKIARAVAPYARPALEYGGAAGGAAAGGALGGAGGSVIPGPGTVSGAVAGGIAGSGLGYAAGKQAANALDEYAGIKDPQEALQAITGAGMDVLHGAVMEAGGQVASKYFIEPVFKWAGGKLADVGKDLYQATMKPSTVAPKAKIDQAIQTGLEGKYWITDKGLEKLKSDRKGMALKLGKVVDKMTGRGAKVNVNDVISEVDKIKANYKGIDQEEAHAAIDERMEAFYARVKGQNEITAKEAHEIKQGIYKDLGEKAYGEMKASAKEADKQIARHINDQLKAAFPEYGRVNQDLADKINLQKYLERAVNRTRNHNRVSLTDMIAVGSALSGGTIHGGPAEGAAMATATYITKKVLDSPAVKSRLAYALTKSAKLTGKSLGRPMAYGTNQALENAEIIP